MSISDKEMQRVADGLNPGEAGYTQVAQFGRDMSQAFVIRHEDGSAYGHMMHGDTIHGGWHETGLVVDLE